MIGSGEYIKTDKTTVSNATRVLLIQVGGSDPIVTKHITQDRLRENDMPPQPDPNNPGYNPYAKPETNSVPNIVGEIKIPAVEGFKIIINKKPFDRITSQNGNECLWATPISQYKKYKEMMYL